MEAAAIRVRGKSRAKLRLATGRSPGEWDDGVPDRDECLDPDTIWQIRSLFHELTRGDADHELIDFLNEVSAHRLEFQQTAIAWIDLIEVLVQTTEGRYRDPGRGALKKDEVKAAVAYLIRAGRFNIPHVPSYLQPIAVDVFADFTVDAIVAIANDTSKEEDTRTLWVVRPAVRPSAAERWRALARWVSGVLHPVLALLGRLASRVYLALRHPVRLSPALRAAVEAVEREGLIAERGGMIAQVVELKRWIGRNHDPLVAGIQLVGLAVREVEELAHLEGARKKACARTLVLVVLDELGLTPRSWPLRVKMELVVDIGIDAIVTLFNKRGVFTHRAPQRPALPSPRV